MVFLERIFCVLSSPLNKFSRAHKNKIIQTFWLFVLFEDYRYSVVKEQMKEAIKLSQS
jgi:hypothetical protein